MKEMNVEPKFNKSIIVAALTNKLQNTIQYLGSLIFGEPTMNSMIIYLLIYLLCFIFP